MMPESYASDPRDADAADLDAMLRVVSGDVPDDVVDWDAFHQRLAIRAELPLARLRYSKGGGPPVPAPNRRTRPIPLFGHTTPRTRAWWEYTAQWSRITVGSAAAASIVLVAVIRLTPKEATEQVARAIVATTSADAGTRRAAFESEIVGRAHSSRIDTIFMPSAAELLIPLGSGGSQ